MACDSVVSAITLYWPPSTLSQLRSVRKVRSNSLELKCSSCILFVATLVILPMVLVRAYKLGILRFCALSTYSITMHKPCHTVHLNLVNEKAR